MSVRWGGAGHDPGLYSAVRAGLRSGLSAAERAAFTHGWSFPDLLADVMRELEREQPGRITRTRPGSWEADHLRAIVGEHVGSIALELVEVLGEPPLEDDPTDEDDGETRPYVGEFS